MNNRRTWRDRAKPIIAAIIRDNRDLGPKYVRKALREAYPFGARRHWPYKVWLDEIKRQTGRPRYSKRRGVAPVDRNQLKLNMS